MKLKNKILVGLILFMCMFIKVNSIDAKVININSNEDYLELIGHTDPFGEDSTIVLNTDVTVDDNSRDNFHVKHNVILDLNGHTITLDWASIEVWFYTSGKTFTIIDSGATKGKIVKADGNNYAISVWQKDNSTPPITNNSLILDGITYINETTHNSNAQNIHSSITPSEDQTINIVIKNSDFTVNGNLVSVNYMNDEATRDYWNVEIENTTITQTDSDVLMGIAYEYSGDVLKYKDFIDVNKSAVYLDNVLANNEDYIEYGRNINVIEIRNIPRFEVIAPTFNSVAEDYATVGSKNITINALVDNRSIKSVSVSGSDFIVDGPFGSKDVVVGTPNTSYTIKPKDNLSMGSHTATITVTDTTDKTYTTTVEFVVDKYASTQIVMNAADLKKFISNNNDLYPEVTTIKLGANISVAGPLDIYPLNNKTLDLNGYTLSSDSYINIYFGTDSNFSNYNKYKDAVFNIIDTSAGSGAITSIFNINHHLFQVFQYNDGTDVCNFTLNVNGGTYNYTSAESGIFNFHMDADWSNNANNRFDFNINNAAFNLNLSRDVIKLINVWDITDKTKFHMSLSNTTVNLRSLYSALMQDQVGYTVDEIIPSTQRIVFPKNDEGLSTDEMVIADRNTLASDIRMAMPKAEIASYQIRIEAIEGFEVIAPTFDSRVFGYADEAAKAITIKTVGPTRTVKSVVVSDNTLFTPSGVGPVEIASNALDNTTFTIKPNHGLGAGTHSATITVTDSLDNTYTAQVSFVVNKANITPSVNITSWEYGDTPSSPVVSGNTGTGAENFFYVGTGPTSYYSNVRPTDVGTYKVVAIIGETDNYNSAECENAFEITKKIVDVTDSKIYFRDKVFDKNSSPLYTIEEGAVDISSDYFDVDFEITDSNTTSNEMVGEYDGKVILTISPHVSPYYMFSNGTDTYEIVSSYEIKAAPVTILDTTNDSAEIVRGTTLDLDDIIDINYALKDVDNFEAINGLKDLLTYEIDDSYTGSEITLSGSELTASNTASIGDTVKINVSFPGYNYDSNGSLEFSSSLLSVYVEVVNKPSQTINITNNTVNLTYGNVYSNPITSSDNTATITYSSSDSNIVEVNTTTGELTAKKYSSTPIIITVSASETATHSATSNTYTVNVVKASLGVSAGTYKVSKEYDAKTIPGVGSGNLVVNGVKFNDNLDIAKLNVVATPRIYASANITPADTTGYVDIAITGTASENYTLKNNTVLVPYEITPAVITLDVSLTPDCIYSGSTCVPTTVVVTNQADSSTISSDDYTFAIDADADTINSGEVWFTITAKPGLNYTWEPHRQYYLIYKALTPTFADLNRTVLENKAETYSIDYSAISLSGLKNPVIEDIDYDGELISTASLDSVNSKINYTVLSKVKDTTGTLTLTISSDNHENSTIDIVITAVAKTPVVISGYTISDKNYDGNGINVSGTLNATEGYDVSNISCVYTGSNSYNSSVAPINAGTYTLTCSIPESDANYMGEATWTFNINKVNPTYNMPSDLVGTIGSKLSSITLPDRFSWETPTTDLVAGAHEYDATYTPEDDINYNTVTGIKVNVYTKDKYDITTVVNGGNGVATGDVSDVLEGTSKEIAFTPNSGYMIDTVLVNDVDKTGEVVNNKLTITVNSDIEVKVSYKKIPFNFVVTKGVGVSIDPADIVGITTVYHSDSKVLTITAEFGYRLKSIKVNGVEKLGDLSLDNKLTISSITENTTVEVVAEKIVYEVLEGRDIKTKDTTKFRFKFDAEFSKFTSGGQVFIDNTLVDSTNYTAEEGSTIITLTEEYANSLPKKKHSIKVVFNDGGEASTNFTIVDPNANPQTGDNVITYVITFLVSLVSIGSLVIYKKKSIK